MRRAALLALAAPSVLAVGLLAFAPDPAGASALRPAVVASALPAAVAVHAATAARAATAAVARSAAHSAARHTPSSPVRAADAHPSAAVLSEGKTLFDESCSSCHGLGAGGSSLAPNLRGLGSGIAYLWMASGWMPLANPTSQPIPKPPLFTHSQIVAIASYVGSLQPGGLPIYSVDLSRASEGVGLDVFALNCAPCHTITGVGDAISDGNFAPSLHAVNATQVAEAVRSGPGNMPVFSTHVISNRQLADLAAYVTKEIGHPTNPGGLGLGGVGPVAEGFIALFIGVGACVVGALWIGERAEDERSGPPGPKESHDGDGSGPSHGPDGAEVIHA